MQDKVIKQILKEIAAEFNLTQREVQEIYESQWDFVHEKIEDIDFNDVTEEEFDELKTNFNIPGLGKFYTTYYKLENVRERSKRANGKGSSPEDDVQQPASDCGEETEL